MPMSKSRYMDALCIIAMVLAVAVVALLPLGERLGVLQRASAAPAYADRLFDDKRVHTVDLQVEDWGAFVEQAAEETYIPCAVAVDGEVFQQVGLRAKGNNSLRLTQDYGLSRYSLKLEFDHYLDGGNYYGLDKFSLDASFQDNSYLKTWLAYDVMRFLGVPAPLCSYAWVTVNGVPWGLFLAVEEPEEAFARRNFGETYGQLYQPDYRSLSEENADVALRYVGEDPEAYDNIFRNAKFSPSKSDQARLIRALWILSTGENLEEAVYVDGALRYFAGQVFLMNWDSYLGPTGHNYFLYEEEGMLMILPWDYNLAFGTYALGMPEPIRDPNRLINYPIYTPAEWEIMRNRPLYHNLMQNEEYFARYRAYFDQLLEGYFESGRCEANVHRMANLIYPYVEKDPTAFCSLEDHRLAVETLLEVCYLRAASCRGQLEGKIPSTLRARMEYPGVGVDASHLDLADLGDFDDLENARERQTEALNQATRE